MNTHVLADMLINIIGLVGTITYLVHLHRSSMRSPLENVLTFFFWMVSLLLATRTIFWAVGEPISMQKYIFIPALMIPIASFLTVEVLVRRHAPLPFKIIVTVGTVIFLLVNLIVGLDDQWLVAVAVFMAVVLAMDAWMLLTGDSNQLAESENRLINAISVAALFSIPLVASDFRMEIGVFPNHLGAISVLLLVYVFVRNTHRDDRKRIVFGEIATFLVRGAGLAIVFWVLLRAERNFETSDVIMIVGLAVACVLAFSISDLITALSSRRHRNALQKWLMEAPMTTGASFIDALKSMPHLEGNRILTIAELDNYDPKLLISVLWEDKVLRISRIKRRWPAGHSGRDQLINLLETHQTSHACLLSENPLTILLCRMPEVKNATFGESDLLIIQKIGSLLVGKASA